MQGGTRKAEQNEEDAAFCVDVAYDFYGERLASGWSNGQVRMYERGDDGNFEERCRWEAHTGPVRSVDWGHPEFSSGLVASCGDDRRTCLWRENSGSDGWAEVAVVSDTRDEVRRVKFAPRHLGLRFALASADGFVRVYEAVDPVDLETWSLVGLFAAGALQEDGQRQKVTGLDWNSSPLDAPELVVSVEKDGGRVWQYHMDSREWRGCARLPGATSCDILDVAWAPNPGRTFHLLAAASRDRTLVWKLGGLPDGDDRASPSELRGAAGSLGELSSPVTLLATLPGITSAWRVAWNVTGTVLSSAAEDGVVSLFEYAQDDLSEWSLIGAIPATQE